MNKPKLYILLIVLSVFIGGLNAFAQDEPVKDTLSISNHSKELKGVNTLAGSTAGAEIFQNSPEIDVKKALYGQLRGLLVEQGSGSSAFNQASLKLFGKAPLILVDGYVRNLADITADEIENITVLTDAASMAIYGVRGANGVVQVTTKSGKAGKMKITAKYQFGMNNEFRSPDFADSYRYGTSINQALINDGLSARYNSFELDAFKSGTYPMEYPNVNWWNEAYSQPGHNHRLNLTFNGGSERFRYFTAVDYYLDEAMLSPNEEDSRYDSQVKDSRLNIRTNIDVDLTSSTYMRFNVMAKLQESNGPNYTLNTLYNNLYKIPAAAFPIRHLNGTYGGNLIYQANNPVAVLHDSGHSKNIYGTLNADLTLEQDLQAITPGLKASLGISFDNQGVMYEKSGKSYQYMYHNATIDSATGALSYTAATYGENSAVLNLSNQGFSSLYIESNVNGKLSYERAFGKHNVSAAAIYDHYTYIVNGRNNSQKRQSGVGTIGYNYDNRYLLDVVGSYSGSSYLPDGDKFRFFPAVSGAWVISNEAFMQDVSAIDNLRLFASHGISGWDGNLSHELWRSSYGTVGSYYFITSDNPSWGLGESGLPVENLTVEKLEKTSVGFDLTMLDKQLDVSVEGFISERSDILLSSANSVTGIIGIQTGNENAGIVDYKGISASLGWNSTVGDFKYSINGNITYLASEVVNVNQAYQEYDYLYYKGNSLNQAYGLEAIGFFNDQLEINNSPAQTFSEVKPGDVKYKDQNGDGLIDNKDIVKMFAPTEPEFNFGLNLYAAYKGFDLSATFQGVTGVSVNLLNSPLYKPLIGNGTISDTFLDNETPWTAENAANATMPRLTTQANANNYVNSSLWYRNGSFVKLRNLKLGYTFPKSMVKVADMYVYVQGTNLFSFDNIEFADPEQLGAAYPATRAYWAGIKFNF
ncbi:SusC/RagA family TonB-linked outer membrane protein [Maribellus sp. YY47]|uniref:SusC/RagA family TonB-linked outer membrane protein n=1 Tax=Maribellus sp. YY47 TaxID=2929486 RepID=UPI0020016ADB|nr:SusC/RagA family TonB-linked outer membrane protein [Maribellus sp. YY47]MCK3683224.1 SusC/RagA family TonB-linked outer membrane protein [Maribellus sp. YY47]